MKKYRKGFTLIELVITMLIAVIVFGMLAGLIGFATRFYSDESSQVHRQEALRLFAVTFEKDVRRLVEHETFFTITVSGDVTSYTLGDSSTSNIIRYDFNSIENKVYRVEGVNSTVVAADIESVDIVMDLTTTPRIIFKVDGVLDGRGTLNEVDVVIYPRLLTTGG